MTPAESAIIQQGSSPTNGPLSPVGSIGFAASAVVEACPIGKGAKVANALLKAGQQLDRNGLTKAGRALQKHGDRAGSAFPGSTGNVAARNQQGQDVLESILTSNNQSTASNRFGGVDIFDGNTGRGVRFDANRNMTGFLEP